VCPAWQPLKHSLTDDQAALQHTTIHCRVGPLPHTCRTHTDTPATHCTPRPRPLLISQPQVYGNHALAHPRAVEQHTNTRWHPSQHAIPKPPSQHTTTYLFDQHSGLPLWHVFTQSFSPPTRPYLGHDDGLPQGDGWHIFTHSFSTPSRSPGTLPEQLLMPR
jgi:hypothetical protein